MLRQTFLMDLIHRIHIDHRQLLQRIVIIGAVLMLSVTTCLRPLKDHQKLLLACMLSGGAVLIFLRKPQVGLGALILASLLVPFSIGTGTNTSINITVLLLTALVGLWLADMIVRRRHISLIQSKTILPIALFILISFLSFGFGQLPWFGLTSPAPMRAQLGGLAIFLLSTGAFLLFAHQVRELKWLQRLTWLFLAIGGMIVIGGFVPGVDYFIGKLFQRGADGSLFWTWLVALSFSQAVFNKRLDHRWRLLIGLFVLSVFYITMFQGRRWASGWVPPLVAVVAILWVGLPRLGLLATIGGSMVAALNIQKITSFIMVGDNPYSLATRLEAWRIVAEIVKVNPVLGFGPANYYWYTPLFPILGYSVRFSSHNNFVDIVAQTGLLGLGCFLWFAWEVTRLGLRLRTKVPQGFPQAYVYGALGGLAGTLAAGMLGDWVIPFVYNVGLRGFRASVLGWLFLGGLVALEQMIRRSERGNKAETS